MILCVKAHYIQNCFTLQVKMMIKLFVNKIASSAKCKKEAGKVSFKKNPFIKNKGMKNFATKNDTKNVLIKNMMKWFKFIISRGSKLD